MQLKEFLLIPLMKFKNVKIIELEVGALSKRDIFNIIEGILN